MAHTGVQRSTAIRTPDQRLRVFVSSTLVELAAERDAARAAIEQLRLAPVMFESGARPHPAQAVYRAYLAQSDIFIGIYADSYGWIGPGMTISGLEDEFELAAELPRLLYVRSPASDRDPALGKMLDRIRASGETSYKKFTDPSQLQELILTDLATLLAERFDEPQRDVQSLVPPSPVTTLVGRDDDVNQIVGLLSGSDRRLVVLTGAGGIGKTRLALAAMDRTAGQWRDGVAFVDLSAITDARLVPGAIASGLDLVVQGRERSLDALRRRLSDRNMLIVLDNFEQVLDAAPVVTDLLQQAPHLHILVTSRVVMRVRGEQDWRVDALEVPPANGDVAELAQAPALRLFVDRVRDVQPGFELTGENAPVLAELCRRLGGLPLALELAAGWMRLLTPEQMLTQLYRRLEQPGALVDLPDRQQTLTNTISWSYDLLSDSAQQLLAQLSVFAAPFTVDGVVAVCGADDANVIEDLSTLLDSSMVSPSERPDRQRGFQLLDPIRRFAAARLDTADPTLSRLHQYVLEVLKTANARPGSQDLLMRQLDSEQLNLQAVIGWIGRSGQASGPLLRALGDVWVWMLACGHLRQTSELWQEIQALPQSGLRTESDRMAVQWLTANRLLNDGAFAEAGSLIDDIMPVARRTETPARTALLLTTRAIVLPYAAHGQARANFEDGLAVARGADDPLVLGYVLSHYGLLLCVDGEAAQAQERHQETLDIASSLNDENLLAEAHYELALDALLLGDSMSAQSHLAVAVGCYRDFDHLDGLARCIGAVSALALQREDPRLAARFIGATAGARDAIGLAPWPTVTEVERRISDRVRALVPGDAFDALVEAGRSLTIQDALAEAQALLGPTPEHAA
jgi:predicted ATPase